MIRLRQQHQNNPLTKNSFIYKKPGTIISIIFYTILLLTVKNSYAIDFSNMSTRTWVKETTPSSGPIPHDNSGWINLAYSPIEGKGMLFGIDSDINGAPNTDSIGYGNDAWLFDVTQNVWTLQHPSDPWTGPWDPKFPPPGHTNNAVTYDSLRKDFIYYAFQHRTTQYNSVWSYSLTTNSWTKRHSGKPWDQCSGADSPPIYWGATSTYDSFNDKVIVFGGSGSSMCSASLFNETWIFDPAKNSWEKMNPALSPPERYGHAAAYDSKRHKTWIFGASGGYSTARNDLWTYDAATNIWEDNTTTGGPSVRGQSSMAYDSINDILLIFGGRADDLYGSLNNDTWVYHIKSDIWEQIATTSLPTNLTMDDVLEYDSTRNVFILFTNDGIWYYRHAGGVPEVDTIPPAKITTLLVK